MKKIRIVNRSSCWHYDFSVDGKRIRASSGLKATPANEPQARQIAEIERAKLLRHAAANLDFFPDAMTAVQLFDQYYELKEKLGRAEGTLVHYRQNKRLFVDYFGDKTLLCTLTSKKVQDWAFWISQQEVQVPLWTKPKNQISLLKRRNHWHYNFEVNGKRTRRSSGLLATEENRQNALEIGITALTNFLKSQPGVGELPKHTYSSKSVREAINWLSSVFKHFEMRNPCIRVERPQENDIEREDCQEYYTPDQLRVLLTKCREKKSPHHNPRHWRGWYHFYSWFVLISHTGMRSGEAQGIRAMDIAWDNCTVRVTSSKTKTRRVLNLSPEAFREEDEENETSQAAPHNPEGTWLHLTLLHAAAEEHYSSMGKSLKPSDNIYLYSKDWLYYKMNALCQLSDIPFLGIHALRHTFATIALKTWNINILSKFLGHKDISTTFRIYGHLMPQDRFRFSLD